MYSAPAARTFLVVAALACPIGQSFAQTMRQYEQRVDTLAQAWRRATAQRIEYGETHGRDYRGFDTVTIGPMRILTERSTDTLARRGAEFAVASLSPLYGRALDELRTHTLVVRTERATDTEDTTKAFVMVAEARQGAAKDPSRFVLRSGREKERFPVVVAAEKELVAAVLRDAALKLMLAAADTGLGRWLFSQLPVDTVPSTEWTRARIDLLSSQAVVARRCYAGSVHDCRLSLGITESADPALDWFDAADRRKLVEGIRKNDYNGGDPVATEACYAGSDSACVSILRSATLPTPVSSNQRINIVRLAISLGGSGSMERLLLTPGTVDARIAAAACVPTDSVVQLWVARARSARTVSDDMSPGIAASSLGWILLCGVLALRSSRWR
jgi:hypothetical protein